MKIQIYAAALLSLVFVLYAAVASGQEPMGWRVLTIDAGDTLGFRMMPVPEAVHVRCTDDSVHVRLWKAVSGTALTWSRNPNPSLTDASSWFTVFPASTDTWNIFTCGGADSIQVANESTAAVTVYAKFE